VDTHYQSWKSFGDNADMAMIEVVDFNELYNGGKRERKKAVVVQKLKQTSEASFSGKTPELQQKKLQIQQNIDYNIINIKG
jgi:hypothetical protein